MTTDPVFDSTFSCWAYVDVVGSTGVEPKRIPRGTINEDVIWAYRNGQCTALARVISEQTGWPIVFVHHAPKDVWCPKEWTRDWDGKTVEEWRSFRTLSTGSHLGWAVGTFIHAFVRPSDDTLLDIGGSFSDAEVKEWFAGSYGSIALLEATIQDIEDLVPYGVFPYTRQPRPDLDLAREFAQLVLKRAGYRI